MADEKIQEKYNQHFDDQSKYFYMNFVFFVFSGLLYRLRLSAMTTRSKPTSAIESKLKLLYTLAYDD